MLVDRIIRNLKSLDVNEWIGDAIDPNQAERLNREQLEAGLGNDQRKLRPKYKGSRANASASSKRYARKKSSLNSKPGFGTPDLKLTGEYHRSLDAKIKGDELILLSNDPKDKFLEKWDKRKGLTDKSVKKIQKDIKPKLRESFLREVLK